MKFRTPFARMSFAPPPSLGAGGGGMKKTGAILSNVQGCTLFFARPNYLHVTLFTALYALLLTRNIFTELNSTSNPHTFRCGPGSDFLLLSWSGTGSYAKPHKVLDKGIKSNCFKDIRKEHVNINALHSQWNCPFLTGASIKNLLFCHSKIRIVQFCWTESGKMVGNSFRNSVSKVILSRARLLRLPPDPPW
jgi:hypothetical protein